MNVIHLSLPAACTLTLPAYKTNWAAALAARGDGFRQFDLNIRFWRYLFSQGDHAGTNDLWHELTTPELLRERGLAPFDRAAAHLKSMEARGGIQLDVRRGLAIPAELLRSSAAMHRLVECQWGHAILAPFFDLVCDELKLENERVVSFGINSHEALFCAMLFSAHLKKRLPAIRPIIGSHNYENFSLLFHLDELRRTKILFNYFDAIVLYGETAEVGLISFLDFLQRVPGAKLQNIALTTDQGPKAYTEVGAASPVASDAIVIPPDYFDYTKIERKNLVYQMSITGNKCYFGRCTFCAQIHKHAAEAFWNENASIKRTVATVKHLSEQGIGTFNFDDEALRPSDLRLLAAGIRDEGLRIQWIGRMIAATRVDRDLVRIMAESGCREILLGLETIDPGVAKFLGKVSANVPDLAESAWKMIQVYHDAGIGLTLSMIYGSPPETNKIRRTTAEFLINVRDYFPRTTVILNRFVIFRNSSIGRAPATYGFAVKAIESTADLQEYYLNQEETAIPFPRELDLQHLALKNRIALLKRSGGEPGLMVLKNHHYNSVGLIYMIRFGGMLQDDVLGIPGTVREPQAN